MAQFRFHNMAIWKRAISILFCERGLLAEGLRDTQLAALEEESKMIEAFRKRLLEGSTHE